MNGRRKMQLKFNCFAGIFAVLVFSFLTRYGFSNLYLHFLGREIGRPLTLLLFGGLLGGTLFLYGRVLKGQISWGKVFSLGLIPNCLLILLRYPYLFKLLSLLGLAVILGLIGMNFWNEKENLFRGRTRGVRERAKRDFLRTSIYIFADITEEYLLIVMAIFLLAVFGPYFHISVNIPGLSVTTTYSTNVSELYGMDHQELGEENKEALARLREEQYEKLSPEEKLNALQVVLNMETQFLGCDPVQLISQEILEEGLAGYYSLEGNEVVIDRRIVNLDAEQSIRVLLHEAYHVYQAACCRSFQEMDLSEDEANLRMYREIRKWDYEFKNYYQCEDPADPGDYYQYASQQIEVTAEEYSDEWISFYIEFIEGLDREE